MALPKNALSTWGWTQNSLFTIDNGDYIKNPEYYIVKHFSHFVKKGAVMLKTNGPHTTNTAAFRNPDGTFVCVIVNPYKKEKVLTIENKNYILKPNSFNTIVL